MFYGANRPGASVSQGMLDQFWLWSMQGGLKNTYDSIKAFSETDFTEDLKKFDVPTLDLILSGHLHISRTSESAARYKIPGHSALVIHAETATSKRARGELNSFNIIQVDRSSVAIQCLTWNRERSSFFLSVTAQFQRTPAGWQRTEDK